MRKGEAEQVKHDFVKATGISSSPWMLQGTFLTALQGRERAGEEAQDHRREVHPHFEKAQQVIEEGRRFRQGSQVPRAGHLYPDVVESGGGDGAANIKSHHMWAACRRTKFQLIEPLRTLFRTRSGAIGTELRTAG